MKLTMTLDRPLIMSNTEAPFKLRASTNLPMSDEFHNIEKLLSNSAHKPLIHQKYKNTNNLKENFVLKLFQTNCEHSQSKNEEC
jgi:hypothetical protein